jgi:hypothetical protein
MSSSHAGSARAVVRQASLVEARGPLRVATHDLHANLVTIGTSSIRRSSEYCLMVNSSVVIVD